MRPYGEDRVIILTKFLVKKESSAAEDSITWMEKILTEVP